MNFFPSLVQQLLQFKCAKKFGALLPKFLWNEGQKIWSCIAKKFGDAAKKLPE